MKVRPESWLRLGAVVLAACLSAACGGGVGGGGSSLGGGGNGNGSGGGGSGGSGGSSQINAATYLDVAALGAVAFQRASNLGATLNRSFELMQDADGAPRSMACSPSGAMAFVFASLTVNTTTYANCEDSGVLLLSGKLQTADLTVLRTNSRNRLLGADFDLQNTVYHAVPGDGVLQTVNSTLRADRRPDQMTALVGQFNLLRNGRTDAYTNVNLVARGFSETVVLYSATMTINSPRTAINPLKLDSTSVNDLQVLTMTAPDNSVVKVSTLANATSTRAAQLLVEVYAAGNANPVITQYIAADDPSYAPAFARALQ